MLSTFKIDNLKNLCLKVAELWHTDIHNVLGRGNLLLPGGHIVLSIAPPDFKRGLNVGDLSPAQALEFLVLLLKF